MFCRRTVGCETSLSETNHNHYRQLIVVFLDDSHKNPEERLERMVVQQQAHWLEWTLYIGRWTNRQKQSWWLQKTILFGESRCVGLRFCHHCILPTTAFRRLDDDDDGGAGDCQGTVM